MSQASPDGGTPPIDINSRRTLISIVFIGVVAPEVFAIQPGFVQGMVHYMHFSEQNAGDIASAEMWGMAITSALLIFLVSRVDWRNALRLSLAIMVVANVASVFADDALTFGVWRFIAGLGAGGVASLTFATAGLTDRPDRNIACIIMSVLLYGGIVMLVLPSAFQMIGMTGVLFFLAAFPASALLLVHRLPRSGKEQVVVEQEAVDLSWRYKGMAVMSVFLFFLAQGIVWVYLFVIGTYGGATEQQVANALAACAFAGVAGSFTAVVLDRSAGRIAPLTLGIVGTFLPLFFLFGHMGILVYTIAVCAFSYFVCVVQPYYLGAAASFDRTGQMVVLAVAAQNLGLANGPWIAARLITPGDYSSINWTGIVLFLGALAIIIPPVLRQHHLARQSAALEGALS